MYGGVRGGEAMSRFFIPICQLADKPLMAVDTAQLKHLLSQNVILLILIFNCFYLNSFNFSNDGRK
jgi:hypothetical protein